MLNITKKYSCKNITVYLLELSPLDQDAVGTVVAAVYSWHIILSLPTYESHTLYTTICLEGSIVNRCPAFFFAATVERSGFSTSDFWSIFVILDGAQDMWLGSLEVHLGCINFISILDYAAGNRERATSHLTATNAHAMLVNYHIQPQQN